jgi:hypothetical protein
MSGPLSATMCNNGNCGWRAVSVNGASIPPPRYGHAAGVLADNLYVFGGVDAGGNFLSDLWVFNIEDRVWTAAKSSFRGIAGLPSPQNFFPSMSVVGHNLYVEMTGDAGGHAIYRWVPEAPAPSGGSGGGSGADAIATGHTAGIVLGVSIGLANLALLYVLFARTGGFGKLFAGDTPAPPSAAYSAMEQGL